jgi:hypothetical protein
MESARRHREHDRQRAHQQGPLVHLGADQRAETRTGVESPGVQTRHQQFRCFGGERRDPLHQQELAHPQGLAAGNEGLGEVLGAHQDQRGREHRDRDHRRASGRRGERPQVAGGPHEVGFLGGGARDPHGVEDEDRDQDHRVEQRHRVLQRQGERVDRGDRQERDLDRVLAIELHASPVLPLDDPALGAEPPERDEHHHGPADADQQPVGPGHVGQRQRARRLGAAVQRQARRAGLRERFAALAGEHEVHGVFGQHRDQRQDRDREARRDVQLRHLGRPGQQERGSHDGHAEQQGFERMCQLGVGGTQDDRRHAEQHGDRDGDLGASWMNVVEIVTKGRHSVSPAT